MSDIPKRYSWSDAITQIKQQMLAYEPDDSKIYSDGSQTIDVPLPLAELNPPPSDHDIRCYAATAASEPGWPPCSGEYLVMQHPLMAGGFTTALRKEKVLEEIYDKGFLLPEERFVEASYRHYPYGYDLRQFENFFPKLTNCDIVFRAVSVLFGLYSPFHQGWVDDAAPRQCFFIDQYVYDNPSRSDCKWEYTDALIRFDFTPEITDLLRRHEDELIIPSTYDLKETIGFSPTYSSYYLIAASPEIEYNHY